MDTIIFIALKKECKEWIEIVYVWIHNASQAWQFVKVDVSFSSSRRTQSLGDGWHRHPTMARLCPMSPMSSMDDGDMCHPSRGLGQYNLIYLGHNSNMDMV